MDWIVIICGSIAIGVLVHLIVTEMLEGRMRTVQVAALKITRNKTEDGLEISLDVGEGYKHVITIWNVEIPDAGDYFDFKAHDLLRYLSEEEYRDT